MSATAYVAKASRVLRACSPTFRRQCPKSAPREPLETTEIRRTRRVCCAGSLERSDGLEPATSGVTVLPAEYPLVAVTGYSAATGGSGGCFRGPTGCRCLPRVVSNSVSRRGRPYRRVWQAAAFDRRLGSDNWSLVHSPGDALDVCRASLCRASWGPTERPLCRPWPSRPPCMSSGRTTRSTARTCTS
jgi:hypothetical protein